MAGSIKLFQFIQKCQRIIGIYQFQSQEKRYPINWVKTTVLVFCAQWMLTMAAYIAFGAKSMFDFGLAFFILSAVMNVTFIYFTFIWEFENTSKFFKNCEGFIEKRVHSKAAYKELIEHIELSNHFLSIAACISVVLVYITVAPYSYIKYYIFDMGANSFYFVIPTWFPFDWKTPSGYLVAWLGQCAGAAAVATVATQFLNLVFGSCWLFIFIAGDIIQEVAAFNMNAKTTKHENRMDLMERFCDMIQLYLDAKACVKKFNEIIEFSLFAFFSWTMVAIFSILVTIQFQLWADNSNSVETISLFLLIWLIILVFILCEPGARMTNQFVAFSDEVSQCDWFLFPIGMQRMYMIFLSDTQNPINMLSFANITCERATFKAIINTAFSYFMTFRRFSA